MTLRFYLLVPCVLSTLFAAELPDGPGKDVVERVCSGCHGLNTIAAAHLSRTEWQTMVDNMVNMGASCTDRECDEAIDYLARYQGKGGVLWPVCSGAVISAAIVFGFIRWRRPQRISNSGP
jgi:hypothetical protein